MRNPQKTCIRSIPEHIVATTDPAFFTYIFSIGTLFCFSAINNILAITIETMIKIYPYIFLTARYISANKFCICIYQ